jgi:ParB-like chromosome segregation protein Spo0J
VHEIEEGRFGAAIGGTRFEALKLLEKQGRSADGILVTGDYPVPCDVRPSDDPNLTATSLAENFNRERMNALDEAEAFANLASTGHGPIEIAARSGLHASGSSASRRRPPRSVSCYALHGMKKFRIL